VVQQQARFVNVACECHLVEECHVVPVHVVRIHSALEENRRHVLTLEVVPGAPLGHVGHLGSALHQQIDELDVAVL
jgi:hypothetical protein